MERARTARAKWRTRTGEGRERALAVAMILRHLRDALIARHVLLLGHASQEFMFHFDTGEPTCDANNRSSGKRSLENTESYSVSAVPPPD